jgi:acyl carrier protein
MHMKPEQALAYIFDNLGLGVDPFTDSALILDEGVTAGGQIDSLMALQIAVELEDIYGVDILPEPFHGMSTVGQVRLEIVRQTGKS